MKCLEIESIYLFSILLIVVVVPFALIYFRKPKVIETKAEVVFDPKITFGISENIITNYLDTFYALNIQHFVDDKTNEILSDEYVEYKGKFIKSFMVIYGESEILSKYISLCFSNTEAFISKLSSDFDIHLKIKMQESVPTE